MAGPSICVLCLADTFASEVHPVFNPVAPYVCGCVFSKVCSIRNNNKMLYVL